MSSSSGRGDLVARWFGELAVIVVGVLIALAAESAWSERSDRAREQIILNDLLEEFRENEDRMREDIEANVIGIEANEALLARARVAVRIPRDSVLELWSATQDWARFDPVTGTLSSVVSTGDLSLIQNRALRHRIAGWTDRAMESTRTASDLNVTISSLLPEVLDALASNPLAPEQEAALAASPILIRQITDQIRELLADTEEISALIEAELGQ